MAETAVEHQHGEQADLGEAGWRDPKRYAWLLGLLVPLLPFMAWGLVELTGLGVFWFFGPMFVFGIMPLLDTADRQGLAATRPTRVLKWLEQDRYYRWCTYAFIPLQFAALIAGCWFWAHGDLSLVEQVGLALTLGVRRRHRHQHRARARAQAARASSAGSRRSRSPRPATATSSSSTTAVTTCAWRRPRTRPSRAWARASTVPAPHRDRQPALELGARVASASRAGRGRRGRCATTSSTPGR